MNLHQQNHLTQQTACHFDGAVTAPGLKAILSHHACHLLRLFLSSGDANMNIKVFLFTRSFLNPGAFSNVWTAAHPQSPSHSY